MEANMEKRNYGQGYRGQYDRDDEDVERDERYDRWERERQRAEARGGSEYDRGRGPEWSDRSYRGGSNPRHEDTGREEWERGRAPDRSDQSRYERGGFFGGGSGGGGGGEMSSRRQYERDWSEGGGGRAFGAPDPSYGRETGGGSYRGRDWYESSLGAGMLEGTSGFGPGVGPRGSGQRRFESSRGYYGEYGGYGVAPTDYGPSTGYGYGPARSYIGDQGDARWVNQPRQGAFAGRGPRNYKRSDERIREDVNERLTRHPELDAVDVDVRVSNCQVVLMGVVEDRRAKRLAEDIAEDVWGVDDVRNELKVRHGFLASLTGEKADDREVTQPAFREGDEAARKAGRTTGSTSAQGATGSTTGT
jgi:hypothetical protein